MISNTETLPAWRAFVLFAALLLAGCGKSPELPALQPDSVILAFGDSLTHGTGASGHESYPVALAALTGRKVINEGIPGEVSPDGMRRLPGLLERHRPALVIICHGGNDILRKLDLRETTANLEKMVQIVRDSGAGAVLLGVPQPGLFLSSAELYDTVAESTGVLYLDDVIPDVLQHAATKSDPVHPNAAGYREIAERIYAALQEAGAL
ncbi:MAG: arylesterase [Gammaproteobacteria bacterium]|nr:arylesterase [Gammaproteobacteria bacterium]